MLYCTAVEAGDDDHDNLDDRADVAVHIGVDIADVAVHIGVDIGVDIGNHQLERADVTNVTDCDRGHAGGIRLRRGSLGQ